MTLKSHILQGIALSPIAYYLTDLKSAVIFFVSFIFIDLDHYLLYIQRRRMIGIRGMFKYFDDVWENRKNTYDICCIFHTIECLAVLFLLGYWRREFWVVLIAFFIHLLFDFYHLYKHDAIAIRALSFVEYFIRRKRAPK